MKKTALLIIIFEALLLFLVCLLVFFPSLFMPQYNKSSVIDIFEMITASNVQEVRQEDPSIKLIAVGDIMLSRGVDMEIQANDNGYPFSKVKDYLKTGDIVFGNFENPIFPGEVMPISGTTFWARPGSEIALRDAGFNVLSLANNHMGNQGSYGVNYTVYSLNKEGIKSIGAGRDKEKSLTPAIIEKNGIRAAFLAYTDGAIIPSSYEATEYNPGVAYMDDADLAGDIKKAREVADIVIISMHAGTEYTNRPEKKQISFARSAIDNGADLVIGHHPHNIQDLEKYKDKYIFYSLGNFIFDQDWSEGTMQGLIAEISISKKGVTSYHLTPVKISDSQPNIITGEEGEKILSNIVY
ncbi:MAG: CapA family protein [Candidatus Pacebacteria bacterium]|nr:CapA family protein [Candidatus Paceibacterota bacterium]